MDSMNHNNMNDQSKTLKSVAARRASESTETGGYLLNCPFCGHKIRTNTILGTTAFFCDGCFAEIKFREVGLHIDQQQERFNQRDNPWCEEDGCECSLDRYCAIEDAIIDWLNCADSPEEWMRCRDNAKKAMEI